MNEMRVSVCHYLIYIRNPSTWLIQYICGVYRKSTLYHSKRNTEQRQMAKWKRNGNNNKKKTFKQQKTFCTYKNCIHARHIQHRVNVETAKHEESDGERAHSLYVYIIYCEVYTIEHAHMNGARICVKHTCRCVRLVFQWCYVCCCSFFSSSLCSVAVASSFSLFFLSYFVFFLVFWNIRSEQSEIAAAFVCVVRSYVDIYLFHKFLLYQTAKHFVYLIIDEH